MTLKSYSTAGEKIFSREERHANFSDLHAPLSVLEARAEANRCLYCYDAPCIVVCPTSIDIPTFIHQIRTDNMGGSGDTILSQNIMGGTCARACPTEVLCEQACVLNVSQDHPVEIGRLQRHVVDHVMAQGGDHPFGRAPLSGNKIAVVGAGPAGLSCAHRAAMLGHDVTVFEAKEKPGGLNEYGLAAYKMVDDFAQKEVAFLLGIGGIDIRYGQRLGDGVTLATLQQDFDAVYLAVGLGSTNGLGLDGEDKAGVLDAVSFIEELRQTNDKTSLAVGNQVVVIGAGNTAIDAAVQSKRLGAENVTLVYRRGEAEMSATDFEVTLARKNGVQVLLWAAPTALHGVDAVTGITFEHMAMKDGRLVGTGEQFELAADMVLKAIGQKLDPSSLEGLKVTGGKLDVDVHFATALDGVYAGGDCIKSGEDLTVQAVEDGKQAALSIDAFVRKI